MKQDAEYYLRKLIATIFGDGGQRVARFGLKQAAEEAIGKTVEMGLKLEEYEIVLRERAEQTENAPYNSGVKESEK